MQFRGLVSFLDLNENEVRPARPWCHMCYDRIRTRTQTVADLRAQIYTKICPKMATVENNRYLT